MIPLKLFLKHVVIGTPLQALAERVRWAAGTPQRIRHPELWDMYLEDRRIAVALPALIRSDSNCVDVGAHIGSVLQQITELAPQGSHVAVEPVPAKARWLSRKYPGVKIVEAAVSSDPGQAEFFDDPAGPGFSGLTPPDQADRLEKFRVEVVCLDDVLQGRRVDFIKLDVEGAELPALLGAQQVIEGDRPAVLFECSLETRLEHFDYKRLDLYEFFASRGYDVYSVADFVFGRPPMTREDFDRSGTYPYHGFNFVALPAGEPVRRLI